jgi:DNA-binding GntR family transcriptional regulator
MSSPVTRTTKTKGRFVLEVDMTNSRFFAFLLANYLHRVDRARRKIFGSITLAQVAELIGLSSVEPHVRDQAFRRDHGNFETVIGIDGQRASNATSISSALEMPRETVRRNLKQLIKMGYIVKKERSAYVLKPGAIQAPEYQAAIADAMRETLIFMNEAIDQGFIRWEPRQERR